MSPQVIRETAANTKDNQASFALFAAAKEIERLQKWSLLYWAERIGVMLKLRPMH